MRRAAAVAGTLALVLLAFRTAAAQETEAAIVAEIDRLRPEAERLRAVVEAREARLAATRGPADGPALDSVRVASFTVVARPGQIREAEAVFREAWSDVAELVTPALLPDGLTFVYERAEEPTLDADEDQIRVTLHTWGKARNPVAEAARALRQVVTDRVLPRQVHQWLERAHLDPGARPRAYRAMVFSGTRVGVACAEGSVSACWSAMGLGGEENPLPTWYTPEQVDARVARDTWGLFKDIRECEQRGYSTDCRNPDRLLFSWQRAIPVPPEVRAHFLAFALRSGPPDALARFVEAGWDEAEPSDPPDDLEADEYTEWQLSVRRSRIRHPTNLGPAVRERLRVATGTDPDVLMTRWMEAALRPGEAEDRAPLRSTAVVWILFFSALATRSTRWRLG